MKGRATAGEKRVDQGAQRTNGIDAGAPGRARYIDLDSPYLSDIGLDIEVLIDSADRILEVCLQVGIRQPGNVDRTYLRDRNVDLSGAVNAYVGLEIDLTPDSNAQLISRPDEIVRSNRRHIQRRKSRRNILKKIRAENGENLAGGRGGELLKFRQRLRNKPLLVLSGGPVGRLTVLRLGVGVGRRLNLRLVGAGLRGQPRRGPQHRIDIILLPAALGRTAHQRVRTIPSIGILGAVCAGTLRQLLREKRGWEQEGQASEKGARDHR